MDLQHDSYSEYGAIEKHEEIVLL